MLSKTTEYALRAVTYLASQAAAHRSPLSAAEIARETRIPRRYLHHVMKSLAASDLVKSCCGAQGGYQLIQPADGITILRVVNAVEPLGRIGACPLGLASHTSLCPLHAQLDRAYEACEVAFQKVTIHDLLNSTDPIVPLQP